MSVHDFVKFSHVIKNLYIVVEEPQVLKGSSLCLNRFNKHNISIFGCISEQNIIVAKVSDIIIGRISVTIRPGTAAIHLTCW